jgi:hypothetical protein
MEINRAPNRTCNKNKQYLAMMGRKVLNEIVCVNDLLVCEQVIRMNSEGDWDLESELRSGDLRV